MVISHIPAVLPWILKTTQIVHQLSLLLLFVQRTLHYNACVPLTLADFNRNYKRLSPAVIELQLDNCYNTELFVKSGRYQTTPPALSAPLIYSNFAEIFCIKNYNP